uniref:Transposase n=1 Tax=Chenopodium quinoa TaxID=63459 RepID=A0A803ND11_CHEQI
MTWHANGHENYHLLHHQVDGQAWKKFDSLYPKFVDDPRNVRLGLATDGFSPFNSMSIVHSTWPVMLINYNLPPWMIMKPEYLILALLIPGPSSPGNDIDIYLQPLIKDLKDLWEFGLETYDASTNKRFDMHVALMTIVSDFPGYAMLSGWCTKGYLACPECHYKTYSEWFPCSGKNVYRSNRKFLDPSHPWRRDKRNFDGKLEERCQPIPLNGIDIENMLRDFPNAFGKKQNKPRRDVDDPTPWRKKPIKTKDNVSACRDLVELNLMPELQPVELEAGSEEFPRSRCWMSLEQKHVRNKALLEGSMAEGYQAKECVAFIARFLKRSSKATPEVNECGTSKSFFPKVGRPIKGKGRTSMKKNCGHIIDHITWAQVHRYVLFNCDCEEVEKYISEHKICVSTTRKRKWKSAQDHSKDFMDWFREKVDFILKEVHDNIQDHILWLSKGPSHVAKKHTGYSVNGYRFHTTKRDANCVTQNSGVTLIATTHSFASSEYQNLIVGNVNYFGSITEIIEISYHGHFSVVLFRCQWFHSEKDDDELIMMKRSRPKVTASKNHLMEYELQRLQKLKDNAERMEALGMTSLANKILEEKTKALFCPSATLNSTPENDDDASTSEYDGENEFETDNLTSRIRKASKHVSKQVNKSSLCPKTMADVVEVNSCKKHAVDEVQNIHSLKVARVQDQCIQKKEQVISEKKGSKQALCSPGSMSAYLEFRKKQKENNEAFVASNQPLNDSLKRNTRICCAAFNENDNDDADAISSWLDEADALNENDDDVGNEHEGVQELEDELLSNYGREGIQEKYMVHEAGREWVMQAINRSWKAHKCFTKRNYFSAYPNDALLWFHKPDTISEPQFREILQYWHSNEAEDPDKQEPSEARVYKQ